MSNIVFWVQDYFTATRVSVQDDEYPWKKKQYQKARECFEISLKVDLINTKQCKYIGVWTSHNKI